MKRLSLNPIVALSMLWIGLSIFIASGGAAFATHAPAQDCKDSSPTDVMQAFYNAAKAKDWAALKSMMSRKYLEEVEKEAKSQKKSPDEFIAVESQKGLPEIMPSTRNEKIEGDSATLEIKGEKSEQWSTVSFVKEDGCWKVAL